MIEQEADLKDISEVVRESGFVDIFDIMAEKVRQGVTTTAEAVRILGNIRQ
jgi:type II secretory ATPase GspE/PulE/Tfp pilus assembly ATPase PilB-like protein